MFNKKQVMLGVKMLYLDDHFVCFACFMYETFVEGVQDAKSYVASQTIK